MKKITIIALAFVLIGPSVLAQNKGVFSGNLQSFTSFFDRDDKIGANESPQYFEQLSSAEAWLFMNYQVQGFNFSARYDIFNNSNLLNPTGNYSGHGIGFWQIRKEIGNLDITAGSFYDQFGSGLVFRAYEQRLLGLDYAMEGLRVKYKIGNDFFIKGFTGRQKSNQISNRGDRFGTFPEIIMGLNAEKNLKISKKINANFGAAIIKRTISEEEMTDIANIISSYENTADKFDPKWNAYGYTAYTNLGIGKNLVLNGEYVGKTKEAYQNINGKYELKPGKIISTGFNFSKRKLGRNKKSSLGINAEFRQIEDFQFKISPREILLSGLMSYQPSLTRQASYRLLARYNAPAQEWGEKGFKGGLTFSFKRGRTLSLNYSNVKRLDGEKLFKEHYAQYSHKFSKIFKAKMGLQTIFYNQQVYEGKGKEYDNVQTITPFVDMTYKLNSRNSLRFEAQYMKTGQDLGSFANAILELNMSPHYSFAISDMVNTEPVRLGDEKNSNEILHYYSIFAKYNIKTTSFTAAYIKQVEGVNCTGGICRLEPAFSGFRCSVITNF